MPVALAHAASAAVSPGHATAPVQRLSAGTLRPSRPVWSRGTEPGVERTFQTVWQWSRALGGEPVVEGEGGLCFAGVGGLLSLSTVGTGQDPIGRHTTR